MSNPVKIARISKSLATIDALMAARAFLDKIDNMTTHEFERGGERVEREALRSALAEVETIHTISA